MTLNHSKSWPVCTFAVVQLRVDPEGRAYSTLAEPEPAHLSELEDGKMPSIINQDAPVEKEFSTKPLPLSRENLAMFTNHITRNKAKTLQKCDTDTTVTTYLDQSVAECSNTDENIVFAQGENVTESPIKSQTSDQNIPSCSNGVPPEVKITSSTPTEPNIHYCIEKYEVLALTRVEDIPPEAKTFIRDQRARSNSNKFENWDFIYTESKHKKSCPVSKYQKYYLQKQKCDGRCTNKSDNNAVDGNCNNDKRDYLAGDFPLDARKVATLCRHYYPEGGWGWVITTCSVLVHLLTHGLQLSCSMFTIPTAKRFETSVVDTADGTSLCIPLSGAKWLCEYYIINVDNKNNTKMDVGSCQIEEGLSVNIKRSDGRVHSAYVSGVNWETRSVTVEWFERGETKGKEVEIASVIALNPELIVAPQQTKNQIIQSNYTIQQQQPRILRSASKSTIPVTKNSVRPSVATQNNQRRQTNFVQPTYNGQGEQGCRENIPPSTVASKIPSTGDSLTRQSTVTAGQAAVQQASSAVSAVPSTRSAPRRSNVVKEVERLKKNREERRQRQAEEKAEKEALMNQDPGNPNWEFLAMIREYQSSIEFRPLKGTEPVGDHQITVCVRKRPLSKKENSQKEVDVISMPSKDQIIVHEPKNKVDLTKFLENQHFRFDYVFNEKCDNELVYKYTAKPLVKTIFEGGMATCFAYGQTGSGKTHTMGGVFHGKTQDCKNGIYAMVARDVFYLLNTPKFKPLRLVISASFFEIYSGKVFDLLADKAKLRVLEDGKGQVQVVGLTEKVVDTCDEVLRLIQHGNSARTSGQTSANSNSSRSHAVFQLVLRPLGQQRVHGKFSLIDLAGNERGADTSSANRQTRMEGAEINKSLLALKECIRALGRKGHHLPFRASKLTQVLRDSFIGDKSRTCMIAMISPGMNSCEHSLNTLRYADRVKELAATDPETKIDKPNGDEESEIVTINDDSDLERLRSLNEGDMSADMYTFHEAISQLQLAEEEVLDNHKSIMEYLQENQEQVAQLFNMTKDVDYDQDAYSQQWEALLTQNINVLMQSRTLVTEFRSKLVNEEKMSQKMKSGQH